MGYQLIACNNTYFSADPRGGQVHEGRGDEAVEKLLRAEA